MFIELGNLLIQIEEIKSITIVKSDKQFIFNMGSSNEFYKCKDEDEFEKKLFNIKKAICDINFGTTIITI